MHISLDEAGLSGPQVPNHHDFEQTICVNLPKLMGGGGGGGGGGKEGGCRKKCTWVLAKLIEA